MQENYLIGTCAKHQGNWKYDLIGYYLNEGDIDKAYEVAQKMDDESIIEKLRHLAKSGGRNDSKEAD